MNTTMTQIATALTQSIAVDGQSVITNSIPFANNKITGLGSATQAADALAYGQAMWSLADGSITGDLAMTGDINMSSAVINTFYGSDVASASTINLDTATGNLVNITGTTGITAVTLTAGRTRIGRFTGILTMTNGASLVLPGGANITTAANDFAYFTSGPSNIVYVQYFRASGLPIVNPTTNDTGVVTVRSGRMSVTTASASGTFTASEIIAETAIPGVSLKTSSYLQAINLATTGAGGMDTGTAPISGFVSLYAILKADGTAGILACAIATSNGPVYTGANMPSGYTYSALVGKWPTNGSSQFKAGFISGNHFMYQAFVNIFSAQTGPSSLTSQSVAAGCPTGAIACDPAFTAAVTTSSYNFGVASDGSGIGFQTQGFGPTDGTALSSPGGVGNVTTFRTFQQVPFITALTVFWNELENRATATSMWITGYWF